MPEPSRDVVLSAFGMDFAPVVSICHLPSLESPAVAATSSPLPSDRHDHAAFCARAGAPAVVAPVLASAASSLGAHAAPRPRTRSADSISEVYGGGGNSGATYTNDFVELYNLSDAAVDLTGWSVQYFPGRRRHPPERDHDPDRHARAGGHYLVQVAAGAGGTTARCPPRTPPAPPP